MNLQNALQINVFKSEIQIKSPAVSGKLEVFI